MPETVGAGDTQEMQAIRRRVKETPTPQLIAQLKEKINRLVTWAEQLKKGIDTAVSKSGSFPERFEGRSDDMDTAKGRAASVKEIVLETLIAAQEGKIVTPAGETPRIQGAAGRIIHELSHKIIPEDVTDQTAPYLLKIIHEVTAGRIKNVEDLGRVYAEVRALSVSPSTYRRLHESFAVVGRHEFGAGDEEIKRHLPSPEELAQQAQDDQQAQMGAKRLRGGASLPEFTDAEKVELRGLNERINSIVESQTLQDQEEKRELIQDALTKRDKEKLKSELSWSDQDVDRLNELDGKALQWISYEIESSNRDLSGYGVTKEDMKLFDSEYVLANFDRFFDKDGTLKSVAKKEMIHAMYEAINKLLKRVSSNPDAEWRDAWDPMHEGYVKKYINNKIFQLSESLEIEDKIRERATVAKRDSRKLVEEFKQFISSNVVGEMASEIDMRQAYHQVRRFIYSGNATPEDMAKFVRQFPAEKINVVLQGYHQDIIEIAISEFERDLQAKIVRAGNTMPSDLFTAYFDKDPDQRSQNKDYVRVRDNLLKRLYVLSQDERVKAERKHKDIESEYWEIDRALTIAAGISFINTMRGHEIIAMARPSEHFRGQPSFAQYFNINHKWGLGRGGKELFKLSELFKLKIQQKENESFWGRVKRRWVPEALYNKVNRSSKFGLEQLLAEIDGKVLDAVVGDEGITFGQLLREFSNFGFLSRAGWRLDALKEWYKDKFNTEVDSDWEETYKNLRMKVGAASHWLFDETRVHDEVKNIILTNKLGVDYKEKYTSGELKTIASACLDLHGTSAEEKIFSDKQGHKLTAREFIEEKALVYKGATFKALLERSPYDFILSVIQLVPELGQIHSTTSDTELSAYAFYFNSPSNPSGADIKERDNFIAELEKRWGKENVKHLKQVAKVYDDMYRGLSPIIKDGKEAEETAEERMNRAQDVLYDRLATASEKVKLLELEEMQSDDIEDDIEGKLVKSVIFGAGGLRTHFDSVCEDFAQEKGKEGEIGDKQFFYTLARRWFKEDQIGIFPNSNEMKLVPLVDKISTLGQDVFARLWGDVNTWNEAISGLTSLDDMLLGAAASGNMEKIFELHQHIYSLQGIIGLENAQKLNYYVSTVVSRFFQEHYLARFPAPLNFLSGLGLGKKISLSQLHQGLDAMTWKEEDIRDYAHKLWKMKALAHEGEWSMHHLEKALGADTEKYILLQAGPSIIFFISAIILIQFLKKAFEEEGPGGEGEKGRH